MLKSKILFLTMILLSSFTLNKQTQQAQNTEVKSSADYESCAAIFFNGRALVDEYSPNGKCKIEEGMKGKLTLSAVSITQSNIVPTKTLKFKVAIRHKGSNFLWEYSNKAVKEVMLEDILKECKKGDRIVFLTEDKQYKLPHNEIELLWGC